MKHHSSDRRDEVRWCGGICDKVAHCVWTHLSRQLRNGKARTHEPRQRLIVLMYLVLGNNVLLAVWWIRLHSRYAATDLCCQAALKIDVYVDVHKMRPPSYLLIFCLCGAMDLIEISSCLADQHWLLLKIYFYINAHSTEHRCILVLKSLCLFFFYSLEEERALLTHSAHNSQRYLHVENSIYSDFSGNLGDK